MVKKFTTIGLTKETKKMLDNIVASKGESYEGIILRLINIYKKCIK